MKQLITSSEYRPIRGPKTPKTEYNLKPGKQAQKDVTS